MTHIFIAVPFASAFEPLYDALNRDPDVSARSRVGFVPTGPTNTERLDVADDKADAVLAALTTAGVYVEEVRRAATEA